MTELSFTETDPTSFPALAPHQVLIAIHGKTPKGVAHALKQIIAQIESDYNKPCQGTIIRGEASVYVVTPRWEKDKNGR